MRAQALAKIERGQAKDLTDVLLLIESRRVDGASLLQAFEQSRPHLIRYPAIEPRKFEERLREFLATQSDDPTE